MQSNLEVKTRAALDEKNAGNGIFAQPYNTANQQMRYVPPDILFGDSLDKSPPPLQLPEKVTTVAVSSTQQEKKATTVAADSDRQGEQVTMDAASNRQQQEIPSISCLDGTTTVGPATELNILVSKVRITRKQLVQSIQSTVRKVSQIKVDDKPSSDGKAGFIASCENHGIAVKESHKATDQRLRSSLPIGTYDQRGGGSENTIVRAGEHSHDQGLNPILKIKNGDHSTNGGNEETVFVYYSSPTTPEPQKMRDCVKTNTSEATNGLMADVGNSRDESFTGGSESCVPNEKLSLEEPAIRSSIQAMIRIENANAASSVPTVRATGERKHSTQLASISESTQSDGSHSMMVLSEPPGLPARDSEATITDVGKSTSGPAEIKNNYDDQADLVPLHPITRESTIMPGTPLSLEEVMEEIDVEGEWKVPQEGKAGAMTVGCKHGRKVRPSFFDGCSEP